MSFVSDAVTALRDPSSLTRRAAISSGWRLGGQGASMSIRLASNLIMTRLLAPEDFGVMAIVFTLHTGLIMMADIGIDPSIIRAREGDTPEFLKTAWTVQILQFFLISLLLVLCGLALFPLQAMGIADPSIVYGDPDLPMLIVVSAAILSVQGLRSTNWVLAERNMVVGAIIRYEIFAQIVGVIAMISLATYGFGVWSIVWGMLLGNLIKLVASHIGLPGPRMGLNWNKAHADEIWRTGKWLIGASFLGFIANNGDRLIFGALFDPKTFGIYAITLIWLSALRTLIERVVHSTSLAALGEILRKHPTRLSSVLSKIRTVLDIICLTIVVAIIFLSKDFIALLYEPEFHGVASLLSLMSPQILLLRYGPLTSILLNIGATGQIAGISLVSSLGMIIVVPSTFFLFGAQWAVVSVALNAAWMVPFLLQMSARHVSLDLRQEYAVLALIVVGTVLCAATLAQWSV